ncbi:hypothetical protein D3C81_2325640 [compost metagenome]
MADLLGRKLYRFNVNVLPDHRSGEDVFLWTTRKLDERAGGESRSLKVVEHMAASEIIVHLITQHEPNMAE